jgi:hypothetical protein
MEEICFKSSTISRYHRIKVKGGGPDTLDNCPPVVRCSVEVFVVWDLHLAW